MMDMDEITKNLLLAADDPLSLLSHEQRFWIIKIVEQRKKLRDALAPFAALATEQGRAPHKLDSVDPGTTEGRPVADSTDDARFPILIRVGDVRAAAAAAGTVTA